MSVAAVSAVSAAVLPSVLLFSSEAVCSTPAASVTDFEPSPGASSPVEGAVPSAAEPLPPMI